MTILSPVATAEMDDSVPRRSTGVQSAKGSETRVLPLWSRAGGIVAYTIVDADVYEWAAKHRWSLVGKGYVASGWHTPDGVGYTGYLHRLILDAPRGIEVDHINRDRLDNRRGNLRLVTHSQNMQNSVSVKTRSGVRGVYWKASERKWRAQIKVDRRSHSLGLYATIEEASAAVAEARLRLHPFAPIPAEAVQS